MSGLIKNYTASLRLGRLLVPFSFLDLASLDLGVAADRL
jgi:hypothetical protein